ncbi:MAG: hypothetical protein GEU77_07160 [Deltaproteobacteria bacterium]|nr:hypothetical protein [Deltaproteobacteria bacterium]
MNAISAKLQAALPGIKKWIDQTLQDHINVATPVSESPFTRLKDHYPDVLLARARVVVVPRVPFPPVTQLGLPEFRAMEMMSLAGVTYKDTFFVCNGQQRDSLYFHELVHVVQWDRLGVDNFLLAYAVGLMQHGYEQSPLEQMAFELQARFDQQRVPENLVEFINVRTDGVWETARRFLESG